MAMTIANIVIGGVDYLDIDGTEYEVYGDDGVTIEVQADIAVNFLCGTPEPRIRCRNLVFIVTASLAENTLENLKLAWSMPNIISYGDSADYLFLGLFQTLTSHALKVRGYAGQKTDLSELIHREFYFRKAVSFEPGPQDLRYTNTVVIPVRFYCYGDSSEVSGREFGYIEQDKQS